MKHSLLLFAGLILLTGCQQTVWYRPGTPPEQMQADLAQAQLDAQRSVRVGDTVIVANNSRQAVADAAVAGAAEAISIAIQEAQMTDSAMRAKGYVLVPVVRRDQFGAGQPAQTIVGDASTAAGDIQWAQATPQSVAPAYEAPAPLPGPRESIKEQPPAPQCNSSDPVILEVEQLVGTGGFSLDVKGHFARANSMGWGALDVATKKEFVGKLANYFGAKTGDRTVRLLDAANGNELGGNAFPAGVYLR